MIITRKPTREDRIIGAVVSIILFVFLLGYAIGSVSAEKLQVGINEEDFENWNNNGWVVDDLPDAWGVVINDTSAYQGSYGFASQKNDALDDSYIYLTFPSEYSVNVTFRFKYANVASGINTIYLGRINLNTDSDNQITIKSSTNHITDIATFYLSSKIEGISQSYNTVSSSQCGLFSWQEISVTIAENISRLYVNSTLQGNINCGASYNRTEIGHHAGTLAVDWLNYDNIIVEWYYEGYRYDSVFDLIKWILLILILSFIAGLAFYLKSGWRR